jgi:hypothetical protein
MNGFFEAIRGQSTTLTLAGREVTIERARLGLHLELGQISDAFEAAPGSPEMTEAIQGYFEVLGVDISQAYPVEVLRAFGQLRALNAWQWQLAFMKDKGPKGAPEPYDYEGRNWAWVVHKLASRYGWSRDEVFNLYPEEAAAYLQEILISETLEAEERYSLSELAYQYDSVSKRSNYVPYRKPGWMYSTELPKPVRVHKAALPYGVVSATGERIEYHH